MDEKIAVCLATFNGASFLEEQLLSLINQQGVEFRIYIRDDLSTDSTINIIEKYRTLYPNRIFLVDNQNMNLGSSGSFRELLRVVESDYYFFCDQDDIWIEDKIYMTFNALKKNQKESIPCGIFTDAVVIDKNKNIISESFWAYQKLEPQIALSWKKLLAQNVVMGCSFAFNKSARDIFLMYSAGCFHHDHLLAVLISKNGKISFIQKPLLMYRQHQNNILGAIRITPQYFIKKLRQIWDLLPAYKTMIKSFEDISLPDFLLLKFFINIKRIF